MIILLTFGFLIGLGSTSPILSEHLNVKCEYDSCYKHPMDCDPQVNCEFLMIFDQVNNLNLYLFNFTEPEGYATFPIGHDQDQCYDYLMCLPHVKQQLRVRAMLGGVVEIDKKLTQRIRKVAGSDYVCTFEASEMTKDFRRQINFFVSTGQFSNFLILREGKQLYSLEPTTDDDFGDSEEEYGEFIEDEENEKKLLETERFKIDAPKKRDTTTKNSVIFTNAEFNEDSNEIDNSNDDRGWGSDFEKVIINRILKKIATQKNIENYAVEDWDQYLYVVEDDDQNDTTRTEMEEKIDSYTIQEQSRVEYKGGRDGFEAESSTLPEEVETTPNYEEKVLPKPLSFQIPVFQSRALRYDYSSDEIEDTETEEGQPKNRRRPIPGIEETRDTKDGNDNFEREEYKKIPEIPSSIRIIPSKPENEKPHDNSEKVVDNAKFENDDSEAKNISPTEYAEIDHEHGTEEELEYFYPGMTYAESEEEHEETDKNENLSKIEDFNGEQPPIGNDYFKTGFDNQEPEVDETTDPSKLKLKNLHTLFDDDDYSEAEIVLFETASNEEFENDEDYEDETEEKDDFATGSSNPTPTTIIIIFVPTILLSFF